MYACVHGVALDVVAGDMAPVCIGRREVAQMLCGEGRVEAGEEDIGRQHVGKVSAKVRDRIARLRLDGAADVQTLAATRDPR